MQKKNYSNAEIEVFFFDKKDVITASGFDQGPDEDTFTPAKYSVADSPLGQ